MNYSGRPRLSPLAVMGEPLHCSRCKKLIDWITIPAEHTDPATFVCYDHWQPIKQRRDMSGYDPKNSPWPAGF